MASHAAGHDMLGADKLKWQGQPAPLFYPDAVKTSTCTFLRVAISEEHAR